MFELTEENENLHFKKVQYKTFLTRLQEVSMKSPTSLVAEQTRLSEWAQQIKDCKNRPDGMKIDEWCQTNGMTKAKTVQFWKSQTRHPPHF